ncbi:MAG: SusC/RagA family TonB-linked outer membrane protein [Muribaculaceae bacterium]|nr:SusC/RagA family TonB-linked outer membrane protein [Muribaculaceae bacterium]
MKKLFLLLTVIMLSAVCAIAQNRTVRGTVISAVDQEPLVGATVMPIGGGQGVATDMDGKFVLTVPQSVKKIKVSYVGMATKEVNITSDNMTVELDNANTLDEVIAVAFGTEKKSAFTGAATVVKAEDLEKHVTTNVADALVGSVAGLQMRGSSGQPGGGQGSINIRGIASMYASTDPLVIVDGSPYTASLSNLPQEDIESVSVLKDAASAALYGARGAAGVIIITTKRGNTEQAKVSVDMRWGSNSRALQEYDVITDPGQYYEAYYTQLYNRNLYGLNMSAAQANAKANSDMLSYLAYNIYNIPEGQQLIGLNGKLNPYATKGRTYEYMGQKYYLTNDDWTDIAYKNGLRQEYTATVNGGNDRASYYASASYLNEEGIIDKSNFKRLTARFKGDYQAKRWLKLGVNVGYVNSTSTLNPNSGTAANSTNMMYFTSMLAPIYPLYVRVIDENGQPVIREDQYGHKAYDWGVANQPIGYGGINRPFMQNSNPIGNNIYNTNTSGGNQLNATFTADFTLTSWLKANISSNVNWGQTQATDYQNCYYGPSMGTNGALTKSVTTGFRTNNTQTLTYFKDFGPHNVNVMVGHEYYRTKSEYLGAAGRGGFSPDILELNAFADRYTSNSYKTVYNVEGYFGRAQYEYDGKYFASASYRRDASSRFATNKRWGNFWSVGAAWLVNKDFLTDAKWLNNLKLKASIGQQGNDNIGNWAYIDLYSLSIADKISMSPNFYQPGNPDITWETTTNFNFGIEFAVLNNRLSGNIDVYTKKTTDLLFWLSTPETIGYRGYYGNLGDIRNTGIEVALTGSIIRTRDYSWDISLNFSHNATKILSLPPSKVLDRGGFTESKNNIGMWYKVGGPLYNVMLPVYAGPNEQGEATYYVDSSNIDPDTGKQYVDRPGKLRDEVTTNPNEATYYELGSSLPTLFGGFSTSVRLGRFDASATFDYQIGGKLYDQRYASLMTPTPSGAGGSNFHKDYAKAWTPENTESMIPRWQYGDQYPTARSNRFLTDASYLNFQSFTVGYTLPKFCKEISKVRVYVIGENLCFWSKRQGFDPRYAFSGNGSIPTYSPLRNISGGVQVNF